MFSRPSQHLPLLLALALPLSAQARPLWPCSAEIRQDVLPRSLLPGYQGGPIVVDMAQMIAERDPKMPQGGSYGHSEDVSNLTRPLEMPLRVTWFDAACDAVVIDGQPVSATSVPKDMRIGLADDSMLLLEPDGYGAVVLRGVPSQLWADGAAMQIHGSAGDDSLLGTGNSDLIVPGGGNDTVAPGAGDDRILFSRGSLTIANAPADSGIDVLDLRRFTPRDLAITATGADMVITTPDGTLRLEGQLTPEGNVETVLLAARKTMAAEDLRAAIRP